MDPGEFMDPEEFIASLIIVRHPELDPDAVRSTIRAFVEPEMGPALLEMFMAVAAEMSRDGAANEMVTAAGTAAVGISQLLGELPA